jgi:regulator of protease activity HflC (stomatin/prohibitin superfamily)
MASSFVMTLIILCIIVVFMGVKIVPQGMEFNVERFGKYTQTIRP